MSDNDPHNWMHFYQLASSSSESTLVSAIPHSASPPTAAHPNPVPRGSSLNLEGRVTKPARRRPRASRRTPTTVMNTDTTNFRALVQQYTGGPPAASFGSGAGPSMLSFGFGQEQLAPSSSGVGHAQYSSQQPYDNLLSLNTANFNSGNSQGSQWGGEGDRRIHFSLEGRVGEHSKGRE